MIVIFYEISVLVKYQDFCCFFNRNAIFCDIRRIIQLAAILSHLLIFPDALHCYIVIWIRLSKKHDIFAKFSWKTLNKKRAKIGKIDKRRWNRIQEWKMKAKGIEFHQNEKKNLILYAKSTKTGIPFSEKCLMYHRVCCNIMLYTYCKILHIQKILK